MALGFAFNKAKILGSAEKYVQQGKLQNAIAEYEKVTKQDPKDLTVLNTIGDLYSRLGQVDRATDYFRRVGDMYAADGFVVKAIAMYKKLAKMGSPSPDAMVRLAELYTQQGLYSDARVQYTAIADQYLKNNDRENATAILKKMLDLDPENAAMQTKVADLYLKLGKNKEALEIYFNSAQTLHQRGSLDAAGEALSRVLKLDPKYPPALLLRGQMAGESGNSSAAIENFSKLKDIDSRPDAQRSLLQAYLSKGDVESAEPILQKMIAARYDSAAVMSFGDALLNSGKAAEAMEFYRRHADRLLAESSQAFAEALVASISKLKDSEPALQSMLVLLEKTGAPGHAVREVQELLAHSFVQMGQLQQAADLYEELAKAEPENPLHQQNYKQVVARMGSDSATRELSTEEGGQALMADELEAVPPVTQEYVRELAEEITSALTDSELFASYNVPEKAIVPLEGVLAKAPNDVRIRQRLASLYARIGRYADAANCCAVLAEVHAVAGNVEPAKQLREFAAKYREQAGGAAATAPVFELPVSQISSQSEVVSDPSEPIPFQASSVAETKVASSAEHSDTRPEFSISEPAEIPALSPTEAEPVAQEADHSEEWEGMLTVEEPAADAGSTVAAAAEGTVQEITARETPDEIVEETQFYLSQGMAAEAQGAIARLEATAPDHPALSELRANVAASRSAAERATKAADRATKKAQEEEISSSIEEISSKPAKPQTLPILKDAAKTKEQKPSREAATVGSETEDLLDDIELEAPAGELEDLIPEVAAGEPASFTAPPVTIRPNVPAVAAPARSAPIASRTASDNPLAGLVSDLEDALVDIAPPPAKPNRTPTPARAAAAHAASSRPAQVATAPQAANQVESNSMLSDLLDEFKEEVDEPSAATEDPDTHYNLGVAFREMGLLDEAIGELQKVCRALDNGLPFSQPIQAYTWLAQCLVDKGAPQAAIRWYEKALHVNGINEDSRMAVYYDMANAFQSAGNKKAALDNFMQVYGSNIDYRDVAERIRSLSK
ncbi:MAG: tetratricopeptide repeat protein [Terriglobales bacterium]